ncbi:MAG TPA: DEAD/DEAH box helicase [bacterium]|nr:DEAD/DEAH box helicase [bacterium]
MESFQELGLPEFLGKSLKQMNFTKPTPVQAQAIPAALEGKDVIASAQTGTGKTGAFGIPLLTFLAKNPDQTALVMTPTRELAAQVLEVLRKLTGAHHLGGSVLLIGGANMGGQISALLKKPRLIIGTPGRIIDHLNRRSLNLSKSGFLVLDEADRMLDMGFEPQLEEIRKHLPPTRQTLLFSATFPPDIQTLGARYLKAPVRISIGETTRPVEKINQMVIYTSEAKKFEELTGELNERQGSAVVFARTQNRVERLLEKLKAAGFKATQVHGGRTQSQRRQAIEQFRLGSYRVLVATDVAARGLDIHHIAHVINYDLPRNPEDYIHRVGRTARAGAQGDSLAFLTPEDRSLWDAIVRLIKVPKDSITVKPSRFGDMTPAPKPYSPHGQGSGVAEGAPHRGGKPQAFGRHKTHGAKESHFRGNKNFGKKAFAPKGDFAPQGDRPPRRDQAFRSDRAFDPSRKNRDPQGRHQRRSDQHHGRGAGFASDRQPNFDKQPSFDPGPEVDGNRVGFEPKQRFPQKPFQGKGRPQGFGPSSGKSWQGGRPFRGPGDSRGFQGGNRPFNGPRHDNRSGGDRPFNRDQRPGRLFGAGRPDGRPGNFSKGPRRHGNDHQGPHRPGGPRQERDGNRGGFQNRHLQEPPPDDIGNR